jgi:hypothetical protein
VGRHSTADDQQLTYWAQRYVLRSDPTYVGPPSDPGAFDGGGLDVPAFLWPCRDAILTTGGARGGVVGSACDDWDSGICDAPHQGLLAAAGTPESSLSHSPIDPCHMHPVHLCTPRTQASI